MPMKFLSKQGHLDRCIGRIPSFVSHDASSAIFGLSDRIGREHAERYGKSMEQCNLLDASS